MEELLTTGAILAVMAALVLLFRLYVRRPRGVSTTDPPGVRTVVEFAGDDPALYRDDRPEEPYVGVALLAGLCEDLAARGVRTVARGPLQFAQHAICQTADCRLCLVLERLEDRWVLSVEWVPEAGAERRHVALTHEVFAPKDTPGLRSLLRALHESLGADRRLRAIRWHRKERWMAEDTSDPAARPLVEGTRSSKRGIRDESE